jgi:flagellar FliJ protein
MRFVFKLQALLNWRRNLEELSQIRLTEKLKQLRAEEEEIQRLITQRSVYGQELKEKSVQGLKVGEYLSYQDYFEKSYEDLLCREERKMITLREIETEREKLLAFTKQRKILEKLKSNRSKKFSYQLEREDQLRNDEKVLSRYYSSPKVNLF